MSYAELLTAVHSLPRRDKLRLLRHLAGELAGEADEQAAERIHPGADYPVWSPFGATDAAKALQNALETETTAGAGGDGERGQEPVWGHPDCIPREQLGKIGRASGPTDIVLTSREAPAARF